MSDQRIQATERMVGANHPTLSDTLNRMQLIAHNQDGSHKAGVNSVDCSQYASLNVAVSAIGSTVTTLTISTTVNVTGNLTVPATLDVIVLNGGTITNGANTIAFNGLFSCSSQQQAFSGTGAVTFATGSVMGAYPQWWGAIANNTSIDQTSYFTSAINSSTNNTRVVVPAGDYRVNLTIAKNGLVLDFEGNTIGQGHNNYSSLRPYNIALPVVTTGDDTNYTSMQINNMNIQSATIFGGAIHGSVGIKITGGTYETHFNNLSVRGGFTSYNTLFYAGNSLPTSKIFINGYDMIINNGTNCTAGLGVYPNSNSSLASTTYVSALYINNFTIEGIDGTGSGATVLVDSAGITMSNGYMDLFAGSGITINSSYYSFLPNPGVVLNNVTLDSSTPGVVIYNNAQYFSGTLKNSPLVQVLTSFNSTLSTNAQINDNGTTISNYALNANSAFGNFLYPLVQGAIFFPDSTMVSGDASIYRNGNNLEVSNTTGWVQLLSNTALYLDSATGGVYLRPFGNGALSLYGNTYVDTHGRIHSGQFTPNEIAVSNADNGSMFVDSADHILKFKDSSGSVHNLY